jgi:hypothetical protein
MTRTSPTSASARPTRQPVGTRNRFALANTEEGYMYRVVNDVDDRVEQLLEAGYEVVPQAKVSRRGDKRIDEASALGSASSIPVGKGTRAVVMRQRKDWWSEDQAAKHLRSDQLEQGMKDDARKAADYGELTQSFKIGK